MIGSLTGKISHIFVDHILLDVSGVGYQILLPQRIIANLIKGDELFLLIHTFVREDNISLFGFSDLNDKEIFLSLNKISGIGSKTTLNILGQMNAAEIKEAILYENQAAFTQISGIGTKAAQRIINELKDKINNMSDNNIISLDNKTTASNTKTTSSNQLIYDALSALENLGYQKSHIINIVKEVSADETDLAQIITKSLKLISNQ